MTSLRPPARRDRRRPWSGLRRALSWHRRKLAVLAAVLAVLATVRAVAAPSQPTGWVVVASHDLAGGATLTADDLGRRAVPPATRPDRAVTDPDRLVGRTLVAPLTRGSVLTDVSVLAPSGRAPAAAATAVVAIPLADPTLASLLTVGDRVDVVAVAGSASAVGDQAGTTEPQVVAAGARLITVPSATANGPLGLDPSSRTSVLVEVPAARAPAVLQAAAVGTLSLALR